MLERHGYPAGVPCWVDTAQSEPQAGVDFYRGLFGWDFEDRMPADVPGHYFVAQLGGLDVAAVGSEVPGGPPTPVWSTYVAVDSADETAAKVTAAGGTVLAEPFDVLDAGRMAVFADPSGALLCAWQAGTHKGAQLVNAPSSWNWSDLNTRDLPAAKAFYPAVFGWVARPVEFGGSESTMWCRPGYAEILEVNDPDLRQRQADVGAPAGFEDAIAWMMEMTDDQFPTDVPSHWSVTFSVDDADRATTRAEELGGKVVVPPFDAGIVRVAVLTDPQGAVFSVSRYDPTQA